MVQSIVSKMFETSSRMCRDKERFSIDQESSGPNTEVDRAGDIRHLQSLLEDVHDSHFRQVFPGHESLSSLCLTYHEILTLSRHFSLEGQQDEENVIYTAEGQ